MWGPGGFCSAKFTFSVPVRGLRNAEILEKWKPQFSLINFAACIIPANGNVLLLNYWLALIRRVWSWTGACTLTLGSGRQNMHLSLLRSRKVIDSYYKCLGCRLSPLFSVPLCQCFTWPIGFCGITVAYKVQEAEGCHTQQQAPVIFLCWPCHSCFI